MLVHFTSSTCSSQIVIIIVTIILMWKNNIITKTISRKTALFYSPALCVLLSSTFSTVATLRSLVLCVSCLFSYSLCAPVLYILHCTLRSLLVPCLFLCSLHSRLYSYVLSILCFCLFSCTLCTPIYSLHSPLYSSSSLVLCLYTSSPALRAPHYTLRCLVPFSVLFLSNYYSYSRLVLHSTLILVINNN